MSIHVAWPSIYYTCGLALYLFTLIHGLLDGLRYPIRLSSIRTTPVSVPLGGGYWRIQATTSF